MRKSLLCIIVVALAVLVTSGYARRLKVYSFPKHIAAGQMATIIFENPAPEQPITRVKCTAEKLIAWIKSDVPILRIEQNGKQVFTSLGSYLSEGDSVIASYMVPPTLVPGDATLFLLNDRDASIPYNFDCINDIHCSLIKVVEGTISPLKKFSVIGEGFFPVEVVDAANAIKELQANVGYDKMSPAEQYTTLNKRISKDWGRVTLGDFMTLEQNGRKWELFVESCGLVSEGATLNFIAPPDIKPGAASLTLMLRKDGAPVSTSAPMSITVQ